VRLKFFDELGREVLDRWRRVNFDHLEFAEVATSALSARLPSAHVDPMDVVAWALANDALPPQKDSRIKFGEPAITVFRCESFYIEVLFWVDGTTAIHQHGFSGAFHVLQGSSLESVYEFEARKRFGEHLMLGRLDLKSVDVLTKGAVRPIVAGRSFIHSLFHLDRPSVSIVVRTPHDALAGPQFVSDAIRIKSEALELIHRIGDPSFEARLGTLVRGGNTFEIFRVLTDLCGRLGNEDEYRSLLTKLAPMHPELFESLARLASERSREAYIVSRRRLAKQREHRFFLALLLNLDDRARIFECVSRAFPGGEPTLTVLSWLREIAKVDEVNAWVAEQAKSTVAQILDVRFDRHAQAESITTDGKLIGPTLEAFRGSRLLRSLVDA
jgi:hypothetical protein